MKSRLDVYRVDRFDKSTVPDWNGTEGWKEVGFFTNPDQKTAVYAEADEMTGFLRVVDVETNVVVFGRATKKLAIPASDDCHTYS